MILIFGLKTLAFDGEPHCDLIEQGIRFAFRRRTSLPFDMVLHGLGHQLTEMTPGTAIRNALYDVMNHLELGVGDVHSDET